MVQDCVMMPEMSNLVFTISPTTLTLNNNIKHRISTAVRTWVSLPETAHVVRVRHVVASVSVEANIVDVAQDLF